MGQSTSSNSSGAAAPGMSSTPGSVTQTCASSQSVSHLTTSTANTSQTTSGSTSSVTSTAATSGTGTSIPNSVPSHSTTSPALSNLADAATTQLRENFESLHHQLMQHAGADYDIATTTTLSYTQFLSYISRLNEICRLYQDDDGRVLVFAVKKGTDSSIFWKATVRIACVKYHMASRTTESQRLLNIRQFLQVFRRISYECTGGGLGAPPTSPHNTGRCDERAVAPTTAAAAVLRELPSTPRHSHGAGKAVGRPRSDSELEECVICLERRPDVILPCAHAYCLPCIQQWWEYRDGPPTQWQCTLGEVVSSGSSSGESERTCPVCREAVSDADDTWVISEAPDDALVTHEISKALMGIAGTSARGSGGANHLPGRPDN